MRGLGRGPPRVREAPDRLGPRSWRAPATTRRRAGHERVRVHQDPVRLAAASCACALRTLRVLQASGSGLRAVRSRASRQLDPTAPANAYRLVMRTPCRTSAFRSSKTSSDLDSRTSRKRNSLLLFRESARGPTNIRFSRRWTGPLHWETWSDRRMGHILRAMLACPSREFPHASPAGKWSPPRTDDRIWIGFQRSGRDAFLKPTPGPSCQPMPTPGAGRRNGASKCSTRPARCSVYSR